MCAEKKEEEKPVQKRIKGNPPLKKTVSKPDETIKIIKTIPGKKTS